VSHSGDFTNVGLLDEYNLLVSLVAGPSFLIKEVIDLTESDTATAPHHFMCPNFLINEVIDLTESGTATAPHRFMCPSLLLHEGNDLTESDTIIAPRPFMFFNTMNPNPIVISLGPKNYLDQYDHLIQKISSRFVGLGSQWKPMLSLHFW
jgi:hypothetical protein